MGMYLNFFKKLSALITPPIKGIIIGMVIIMTVVTVTQVFMRYVVRSPLFWAEEAARYLMVWLVFLGAALGIREGAHIALEIFIKSLPQRVQRTASVLAKTLILLFLIFVFKEGIALCRALAFQRSPAIGISMFWPYLSVPTGALLMVLQMLPLFFEDLQILLQKEEASMK